MKFVQFKIYLTVFLVTTISPAQTAEDDDENRPYEFGFTIENYQHRHEKKDINGIIQGEFGFITADGIYHVTVYATDENGDFHILSMKNIRVSPPLDQIEGKSKPGKQQSSQYSSPQKQNPSQSSTARPQFTTQPTIKPACAGCGYVTTPKQQPNKPNTFAFQTPAFQAKNPYSENSIPKYPQTNNGVVKNSIGSGTPQNNQFAAYQNPPANAISNGQNGQSLLQANGVPTQGQNNGYGVDAKPEDQTSLLPGNRQKENSLSRVSVSDNRIRVPGNPDIPIVDKYPNMADGLPPGIDEKDITDLLYKFNYTVGFHGHYERGYKSGAKVGGYFVNGRDGISRIVTYVADENGFRPKVKFVNLGLDSPLTPHEDTEKSFGLKSFEFIWYPIA